MGVTNIQFWADTLDTTELPSIKLDVAQLQTMMLAYSADLSDTSQRVGDGLDLAFAKSAASVVLADEAKDLVVALLSKINEVEATAAANSAAALATAMAEIRTQIDNAQEAINLVLGDKIDDGFSVMSPELLATIAEANAQMEASKAAVDNIYAAIQEVTDDVFDVVLPRIQELQNDLKDQVTAFVEKFDLFMVDAPDSTLMSILDAMKLETVTLANDVLTENGQVFLDAASNYAQAAEAASNAAEDFAGQAEQSKVTAETAAGQAESYKDSAATSASDAAGSAAMASTSESNTADSASEAQGHASAAASSASVASTKAGEADVSAQAAEASKLEAATAAGAATVAATQSATSASDAEASNVAAASKLALVADLADTAATNASAAAVSASEASVSATQAATEAQASETSRLASETANTQAQAAQTQAAQSATDAAGAASAASASAALASGSANDADYSANAANLQASAAATSANDAAVAAMASEQSKISAQTIAGTGAVLPSNFIAGAVNWTRQRTGSPAEVPDLDGATFPIDDHLGVCAEISFNGNGSSANVLPKGIVELTAGSIYRTVLKFKLFAASAGIELATCVQLLDRSFNSVYIGYFDSVTYTADTVAVHTIERTFSSVAQDSVDSVIAELDEAMYMRIGLCRKSTAAIGTDTVRIGKIHALEVTDLLQSQSDIVTLQTTVASLDSTIADMSVTLSSAISAVDDAVQTVNDVAASLASDYMTAATTTEAIATAKTELISSIEGVESAANAAISDEALTRANEDSALSAYMLNIESTFTTDLAALSADVANNYYTKTDADAAIASQTNLVQSNVDDLASSVTATAGAVAELSGYAAATQSFRVVAGSAGASLELVASDDPVNGAASTAKIAAKHFEVTAESMRITGGVGSAVNLDPNFQDASAWDGGQVAVAPIGSITGGVSGDKGLIGLPGVTTQYGSRFSPVNSTKKYRLRASFLRTADGSGSSFMWVMYYNSSFVFVSSTATETITPTTIWAETQVAGLAPPAGAAYAKIFFQLNTGSVGNHYVQGAYLEEQISSTLIVDGSVIASKLAAGSVTADKISVTSLSAISANLGTVVAYNANIGDGQITTAKIANANITAAKIGDLQVDTLKIAGNAVTIFRGSRASATSGVQNNWTTVAVIGLTPTDGSNSLLMLVGALVTATSGASGAGLGTASIRLLWRGALVREFTNIVTAQAGYKSNSGPASMIEIVTAGWGYGEVIFQVNKSSYVGSATADASLIVGEFKR